MTNEEKLNLVEKSTPALSRVVEEMAKDADKTSHICHTLGVITIIASIVLNLLALILTIPALWVLGTTLLLLSICFYFEGEIAHVRWLALEAHADQIRTLNVLTTLVGSSLKKEKTHGEPRPKGVKRTGRRVHEQGK